VGSLHSIAPTAGMPQLQLRYVTITCSISHSTGGPTAVTRRTGSPCRRQLLRMLGIPSQPDNLQRPTRQSAGSQRRHRRIGRRLPARVGRGQISTGRHSMSSSCASSTSMSASASGTLVSNPFSEYRITCMSLSSSSALVANTCARHSCLVQGEHRLVRWTLKRIASECAE